MFRYLSRIWSFEYFVLVLLGHLRLADLALDRVLRVVDVEVADELLGDRRGALLDLARLEVLDRRADDRAVVDAVVLVEVLVLDRDRRLLELERDLVELHRRAAGSATARSRAALACGVVDLGVARPHASASESRSAVPSWRRRAPRRPGRRRRARRLRRARAERRGPSYLPSPWSAGVVVLSGRTWVSRKMVTSRPSGAAVPSPRWAPLVAGGLAADGPGLGALAVLEQHRDDRLGLERVGDRVAARGLRGGPPGRLRELEGAAVGTAAADRLGVAPRLAGAGLLGPALVLDRDLGPDVGVLGLVDRSERAPGSARAPASDCRRRPGCRRRGRRRRRSSRWRRSPGRREPRSGR